MKSITKAHLVSAIYNKTGVQKCDCDIILDMFIRVVKEKLIQGHAIEIREFGTFSLKKRKARPARNPRKPDEVIMLPDRTVPVFKFSNLIKKRMGQKNERTNYNPCVAMQ
jgi:nucleoid DNA-binding protein